MSMKNYRDVSPSSSDVSAGFQFEFFCEICGETSRSAFQPYRKGQLTGWLTRFAFMFSDLHKVGRATGTFADAGATSAKTEALAEAQALAAKHYTHCETCHKWACGECWNENAGQCKDCAAKVGARRGGGGGGGYGNEAAAESGAACPNCQTPSQGGRFCHECGFDMASTHKSCPGCGATMPRAARFCTDCGHGF
jgi:Uncharacterised protein family UPF0547